MNRWHYWVGILGLGLCVFNPIRLEAQSFPLAAFEPDTMNDAPADEVPAAQNLTFYGGGATLATYFLKPDLGPVNEVLDGVGLKPLNERVSLAVGVNGYAYLGRYFKLGLSTLAWQRSQEAPYNPSQPEKNVVYGLTVRKATVGLSVEGLYPWQRWEFSGGAVVGSSVSELLRYGGAALSYDEVLGSEQLSAGKTAADFESPSMTGTEFIFRPFLALKYKIHRWFSLDAIMAYQFSAGIDAGEFYTSDSRKVSDMPAMENEGFMIAVGPSFGWFPGW
jgi:hypothetical protein